MTSTPRRIDQQTQQIILDATTIRVALTPALARLEDALAGWPTSTPGASPLTASVTECSHHDCANTRPCPDHDTTHIRLTATEQNASHPDKARNDRDRIITDINQAAIILARLANTISSWAFGNLNDQQIASRLTAIDASIWCSHCTQYGRHEPREQGRTECTFCRQFRQDYKQPPPAEIWAARDARNGRLDQTTILRLLKQVKERRALEAKRRKAEQKAAAHA